jgi:ATP-dependent Clp protease ATP-binding subunit ClpC
MTALPEFWRSPDRFEILGHYEYQGRIEAGVRRIGSLLERLRRRHRDRLPTDLLASVAQTRLLLAVARADVEQGRPQAAFLLVEAGRDAGLPDLESDRFAEEIGGMYRAWGRRRNMRLELLHERPGGERDPFRLLLAVAGFGSHTILADEDGLHLLETPAEHGRGFDRARARVVIVPQLGDPGDGSAAALRRSAEEALAGRDPAEPRIVRRYRTAPSPLVRDGVRGWRTGRIERVLGGEFDVMGTDP